jgi:hypothetical protein
MYCRSCGTPNHDIALCCANCAAELGPPPVTVSVPKSGTVQLVLAILATILCCLPFGTVGIVYASQIDAKLRTGDLLGASQSAESAKRWTVVSAALWLLAVIGYVAAGAIAMIMDS